VAGKKKKDYNEFALLKMEKKPEWKVWLRLQVNDGRLIIIVFVAAIVVRMICYDFGCMGCC